MNIVRYLRYLFDLPLQVFETFGPVQTTFYTVRLNESDISDKGVCRVDKVFYAPDILEYSQSVFVTQLKG